MTSGLDAIKGELSEKVHSENVLQYRNIQDLLKELDNREETAKKSEEEFSVVKKRITLVTVVSIVNVVLALSNIIHSISILTGWGFFLGALFLRRVLWQNRKDVFGS